MQTACQAGRILLESGAETYRVEETMTRICDAYGMEESHSFVLPTGVFLTVIHEDNTKTMVVRVKRRAVNLDLVDQINTLSRQAADHQHDLASFRLRLKEIESTRQMPLSVALLAAAMCGSAFAIFYQGSALDALASALCSVVVKYSVMKLEQLGVINFLSNLVGGAMATLLALLLMQFGYTDHLQIVISSTLMLMVPGVAITNAIRDSIAGDLVSGMAKAAEAILIAISIALGTGAILGLWMMWGGG